MAQRAARVVLTYRDLIQLPNDRNRYELFEGELQVTAAPNTPHQTAVINIATILNVHVQQHGLGDLFVAPYDVYFTETTVVEPDLVFVAEAHRGIILTEHIRGVPDLVIEVTSPSTARVDRNAKMQLYARYQVPHYWIFDPQRHKADAYGLTTTIYELVRTARGNEDFSAPPFPELVIRLARAWGSFGPKG